MIDYASEIDESFPQDLKFKYGNEINNPSESKTPFVSYDYLLTDDENPYSFTNKGIPTEEYERYFKKIKDICRTKYIDLENKFEDCNFTVNNNINQKMIIILKSVFKNHSFLDEERIPWVGHFHIYDKDERPENGRCPVVHFFIGHLCTFYILCYDDYHDIHEVNWK